MFDLNYYLIQFFITVASTIFAAVVTISFYILISPRVKFSQFLRSVDLASSGRVSYSVRVKKTGFADLINVSTACWISVQDVRISGKKTWTRYIVPTSFEDVLIMKNNYRSIHLKLHEAWVAKEIESNIIGKHAVRRIPDLGLRLEDFFMSGRKCSIQVFISGTDRFTGLQRLFESPKYSFWCIREGNWKGLDLVCLSERARKKV